MITKEEFVKYLTEYQSFEKAINRLGEAFLGGKGYYFIYECDWYDSVGQMLDIFIDSHFTESGADWIYYYLFENVEDHEVVITKEADMFEGKEEIIYHLNSIDELWDFLLTDIRHYFKNAE